MAYAVGKVPSGVERITRIEMKWTVGNDPPQTGAFFSPWCVHGSSQWERGRLAAHRLSHAAP